MKYLKHIFPVILSIILFSSCSSKEGKVISRGDLAEIYAEMLLADQWIANNPKVRRQADTSLVYEPILNKYGYTTEDYMRSVDKYMDDPERFSKIIRESIEIFDEKLKDLEVRKKQEEEEEKVRKHIEELMAKVKIELHCDYSLSNYPEKPVYHHLDSLAVEMDSVGIYRMVFIDQTDSLIQGPMLIPRDTLSVSDTLKSNL
jgi:hypothetical protein